MPVRVAREAKITAITITDYSLTVNYLPTLYKQLIICLDADREAVCPPPRHAADDHESRRAEARRMEFSRRHGAGEIPLLTAVPWVIGAPRFRGGRL